MTRATIRRIAGALALGAVLLVSTGCGEIARTGRSSGFLIIESLTAASGADPGTFSNTLNSDVQTIVEQSVGGVTVRVPTIFNDLGRAQLRLEIKNPTSATGPSPLSQVTIHRYRVEFQRTDGRNRPGVDVPFGFDGALTATVATAGATVSFQLVSHAMKLEPPLRSLIWPESRGPGGQIFIHTIATITFYGRDQAGNEVSVSGMISVNFGDFADPD